MIIADNQFIESKILASNAILDKIPDLRPKKQRIRELKRVCRTCSGKGPQAKRELENLWMEVRKRLASLSEQQRQFVRDTAAGGQRIRISYREFSGKDTQIKTGEI